jgi:hypothetical protein
VMLVLLAFPVALFKFPFFSMNGSEDNLNVNEFSKVAPPGVKSALKTGYQAHQFQPALIRSTEYLMFTYFLL